MTSQAALLPTPPQDRQLEEEFAALGARLRVVDRVEPGLGVVPVLEEGCVLLRPGEVAVYEEKPPFELVPGLYCLERQLPVAHSPHPDGHRKVSREVVYARPWSRVGSVAADSWEYVTLRSKVINGVRRYAAPEGPLYYWALHTMLLGPVIGIYMPSTAAGRC